MPLRSCFSSLYCRVHAELLPPVREMIQCGRDFATTQLARLTGMKPG